jgi:cytoskeletal protein CcmA (bactofilin family)/anti-sigma factor RsiW
VSCHPEAVYSVYVDGELPLAALREVEAHLVSCRECRALVLALREEGTLLRDALRERERSAPRRARVPVTPARGLALGLLPTVAFLGVALGVAGWVVESQIPAALRWANPLSWIGAYEMAFDLIFWLRDRAPGLLELVVAVAATASVSAILSFAVTLVFRRVAGRAALGAILLAALLAPKPGAAFALRNDESVRVGPDEVLQESLLVSGDRVVIEGVVEGDLFAFAERVLVEGEVRGNVYAVAQSLEVDGRVTGSVHAVSERTDVGGRIDGNLYSFSEDVTIAQQGSLGRDLAAAGRGVAIDGAVGRDLMVAAEWLDLRGSVARNALVHADRAALFDGASIGGDLDVHLQKGRQVEVAEGAVIGGELHRLEHGHLFGEKEERFFDAASFLHLGILLTAMFLVGMALHAVLPQVFDVHLETGGDFFRAAGYGLAALLGVPVALVLVALTVVGIPIALIGLWIYLSALLVSGTLVAALVGATVLRGERASAFGLRLLVGLVLLGIASILPFVGGIFRIAILLTGTGLLVERGLGAWHSRAGAH